MSCLLMVLGAQCFKYGAHIIDNIGMYDEYIVPTCVYSSIGREGCLLHRAGRAASYDLHSGQ